MRGNYSEGGLLACDLNSCVTRFTVKFIYTEKKGGEAIKFCNYTAVGDTIFGTIKPCLYRRYLKK